MEILKEERNEILEEERNEIKEERSKNLTFYFPNTYVLVSDFTFTSDAIVPLKEGNVKEILALDFLNIFVEGYYLSFYFKHFPRPLWPL